MTARTFASALISVGVTAMLVAFVGAMAYLDWPDRLIVIFLLGACSFVVGLAVGETT